LTWASPPNPAAVLAHSGDQHWRRGDQTALSFVADNAVYDLPPPFGLLTGKAAIRGFIETLVARKARIELLGLRIVEVNR